MWNQINNGPWFFPVLMPNFKQWYGPTYSVFFDCPFFSNLSIFSWLNWLWKRSFFFNILAIVKYLIRNVRKYNHLQVKVCLILYFTIFSFPKCHIIYTISILRISTFLKVWLLKKPFFIKRRHLIKANTQLIPNNHILNKTISQNSPGTVHS